MTRRAFDYRAFRDGWRKLAADHGIDPITGCYNYADDAGWWKRPELWHDPGPSASIVERDAIASIAAQARAAYGLKAPPTLEQVMTAEFRAVVKEALEEDRAAKRRELPLRELHALRGETVIDIEGMRVLVPIKVA